MKKILNKRGFSLVEILVAVAIASMIFIAVFYFGQGIFSFNSTAQANLSAQSDARRVLKNIVRELRSTSPSSLGSYPISLVGTSTLTFFVNIDSDAYKEQIRYFLQGDELKRGVIKPSGSPLTYNPANEQISTMIRDIINATTTPVFDYFDSNYAGTTTPMTEPFQITKVRLIRVNINIDKDKNRSPSTINVTSQVFLRNLKDNL
jgi:prepilin-type N-terminal cleavage/methylation domain-containing protein